jgi:hypothetical protein
MLRLQEFLGDTLAATVGHVRELYETVIEGLEYKILKLTERVNILESETFTVNLTSKNESSMKPKTTLQSAHQNI